MFHSAARRLLSRTMLATPRIALAILLTGFPLFASGQTGEVMNGHKDSVAPAGT